MFVSVLESVSVLISLFESAYICQCVGELCVSVSWCVRRYFGASVCVRRYVGECAVSESVCVFVLFRHPLHKTQRILNPSHMSTLQC